MFWGPRGQGRADRPHQQVPSPTDFLTDLIAGWWVWAPPSTWRGWFLVGGVVCAIMGKKHRESTFQLENPPERSDRPHQMGLATTTWENMWNMQCIFHLPLRDLKFLALGWC